MSDLIRARELYLVKEYCDAITDPQVGGGVAQLMRDMRTAAAKSAADSPDNTTIERIKAAVDEAYRTFESVNPAVANELINQLRGIASAVEAETRRLISM